MAQTEIMRQRDPHGPRRMRKEEWSEWNARAAALHEATYGQPPRYSRQTLLQPERALEAANKIIESRKDDGPAGTTEESSEIEDLRPTLPVLVLGGTIIVIAALIIGGIAGSTHLWWPTMTSMPLNLRLVGYVAVCVSTFTGITATFYCMRKKL